MSNPVSPASLRPPSLPRSPPPVHSPSQAHSPPIAGTTISANAAPPQTFWADDFGPTQYTFYRDTSPPSSIHQGDAPRASPTARLSAALGRATATISPENRTEAQTPPPDPARRWSTPTNRWSIGSLPRRKRPWEFWLGVGVVVLVLLGVAVGVGVGVGVGSNKARHKNADAGDTGASSVEATATPTGGVSAASITAASMATPTSASASASASASSTTGTVSDSPSTTTTGTYTGVVATATLTCPATPGARITDAASGRVFTQKCGRDYGAQDGAIDIGHVVTANWAGCIHACGGDAACTGCGWGFIQGDAASGWRCWMKRNVSGEGHAARKDWAFAVLV